MIVVEMREYDSTNRPRRKFRAQEIDEPFRQPADTQPWHQIGRRQMMKLDPAGGRIRYDEPFVGIDDQVLKARPHATYEVHAVIQIDEFHTDSCRPAVARYLDGFNARRHFP